MIVGYEYTSLRDVPTKYIICKTFVHSWDEFIPVGKRKPPFGFRLSVLCPYCGSERHDLMNLMGDLLERSYVRPEDWPTKFRWTRAECRVELSRRKRERERRGSSLKVAG